MPEGLVNAQRRGRDVSDSLTQKLARLIEAGIVPVLLHTPIAPSVAEHEDSNDPEPRWLCYDRNDEMTHAHGYTPEEACDDLIWMLLVKLERLSHA